MCVGESKISYFVSQESSTLFLETDSLSRIWGLLTELHQLVTELQGSACYHLPALGLQGQPPCLDFHTGAGD